MLLKPRLKQEYSVFLVDAGGVLLLSERDNQALRGRTYRQLVPLIDGRRTSRELVEQLQDGRDPNEIWYALWQLEKRGCVVDAASPPAPSNEPSGERWLTSDSPTADGSEPYPIALSTVGEISGIPDAVRFQSLGFTAHVAGLSVVLTDSYLRPELDQLNTQALRSGRPWLLLKPAGTMIWVGPLFRPGHGCCWRCLSDRLRRNRPFEYQLLKSAGAGRPFGAPETYPDAIDAALRVLRRELQKSAEQPDICDLVDGLITLDTGTGCRERHQIARRPRCRACADPGLDSVQYLESSATRNRSQGGTERILADWERLEDRLVGVVHDLEPIVAADPAAVRVYAARYGSDPAVGEPALLACGLERAIGKGVTDCEARVGALGEAIERYCAVFQGDEPRLLASLEELEHSAIHPDRCTQFSQAQYDRREELNRHDGESCPVPPPFDPAARIEWTPVWSPSHDERRYLPTGLLYSGYPVAAERAFCPFDPSGGAAGSSLEDALLRGVLELIERDSLALWWYNRVPRPAIDLSTVGDPLPALLAEVYRAKGRELWVLDLTSDLGVPAFAAVSRRTGRKREAIVMGFGAHLDPETAVSRALLELDQVLTCVTAAERTGSLGRTLYSWLAEATLATHPYLAPAPLLLTRLDRFSNLATDDAAENIRTCERLLARQGLTLWALDQTRPDIGVPVMKAIVPELRHFRARFAPGRLYTAPVRADWLAEPRQEHELNPIPFFL
jgi:oxazoline/thiazoline synthase